ncbi:protein E6-like [Benincasa hispida]|uniref:protein E6-like n=1 Tax=Benincasa hispida TaxID=102211 RepID=UPI0019011A98|nr:protein E6-like [Benincasa hispida]
MAAASTTFNLLSFFFFFILLLSSVQIEARVNKFFSKFINTDREVVPTKLPPAPVSAPPEISPSLAPTPAPAPFFDESQNAYGLYGRDADADENTRTITDVEEEILAGDGEDEDEDNHKAAYPMTNSQTGNYGNNNYENNNGFRNSEYENHNEYRNSEYESAFENNNARNYQYQSNFEDDGYRRRRHEPTRQQGMSDTRFMENGRYFHDINSKNGEENGSYGNNKYPKYEFDSMEEYERSEGLLP